MDRLAEDGENSSSRGRLSVDIDSFVSLYLAIECLIEIVNKAAKSLGFTIDDVNFYNVYYEKDNKKWEEHIAFVEKYLPDLAKQCERALTGREYHTVLYKPKSEGFLWIQDQER